MTGTGENTKFMGLLMGKINGKELEKRCDPLRSARPDGPAWSVPRTTGGNLRMKQARVTRGTPKPKSYLETLLFTLVMPGRLWKDESWADAKYTLEMLRQVRRLPLNPNSVQAYQIRPHHSIRMCVIRSPQRIRAYDPSGR